MRPPRKKQGRPKDARAYIRTLAQHQMLRLPCKKQRRPRHAKAYIRQGVHPTLAKHQMLRLPRQNQRRPRDAKTYIRPLAEHQMLRLPRKKQRRPKDARAYIRPFAEHQALSLSRKKQRRPKDARAYRPFAEHQVLRLPRKKQQRPRDAKAYIRPLAEHQMLRLPRKKQRRPKNAKAHIRPLAEHQVLRLPRKKQNRVDEHDNMEFQPQTSSDKTNLPILAEYCRGLIEHFNVCWNQNMADACVFFDVLSCSASCAECCLSVAQNERCTQTWNFGQLHILWCPVGATQLGANALPPDEHRFFQWRPRFPQSFALPDKTVQLQPSWGKLRKEPATRWFD